MGGGLPSGAAAAVGDNDWLDGVRSRWFLTGLAGSELVKAPGTRERRARAELDGRERMVGSSRRPDSEACVLSKAAAAKERRPLDERCSGFLETETVEGDETWRGPDLAGEVRPSGGGERSEMESEERGVRDTGERG